MKRFLQGFLLVAAGLLVGLGIAEAGVRILAPHSRDHVTPAGLFAIDSTLGWKLQPNYTRPHRTPHFDVEYSINSLGYRDGERTLAKPDSVRRLLLFGDSQVFGWGVPVGRRFSDVAAASTTGLEVWNMAVPGYGFDQEVISYLEAADSIPASGAILFVSKVTLRRMHSSVLFRKPKPRFVVESNGRVSIASPTIGSTALTDGLYRLLTPFFLPYFLEAQAQRILDPDRWADLRREADIPVDSATMSLAKAVLMRAREKALEKGQELFLIATLPRENANDLARFASDNGITFIDTGWAAPPTELIFSLSDQHWVPRLHEELGKRFAAVLSRQAMPTMW